MDQTIEFPVGVTGSVTLTVTVTGSVVQISYSTPTTPTTTTSPGFGLASFGSVPFGE